MVFDAASSLDVHFVLRCRGGKQTPYIFLDFGANNGHPVLGAPDAMVMQFGIGIGHRESVWNERSLRDVLLLYSISVG